ncbi:MAG: hypothetical protein ABJO01_09740 [Parasphingorhabdus sp.]|uniref:hypothetical protein n=1 Tax=Parasphingorhabdus sp. TaxID=2709688 RepID=UPI003297719E
MTLASKSMWTGLILTALVFTCPAQAANNEGYRYDKYSASTDCGDRKPLTEKEQLGLSQSGDIFRILTLTGSQAEKNETAHWMILLIDNTPLNRAMDFPPERCASAAKLQMSDGKEYHGLVEYKDTSGAIEHRGRAYRVLFEPDSPIPELRYDYGGYRIDGHLSYPEHGDKPRPFAGWWIIVER